MFVLEDIGWIILATFLFIIFHTIYEWGIRSKKVVKLNIKYWNMEIVSGIYYAVISLLIQIFIWYLNKSLFMPIGVITSITLITLRSSVAVTLNIIPSLVFFLLLFDISTLSFMIYISLFIGLVVFETSKFFIKKTYIQKIIMISAITVTSFVSYVVFIATRNFKDTELYESTLLMPLLALLMLASVSYFISFSKSANILFDSVTYSYFNYYRHAVGVMKIQNEINEKSYKYGLFVVFKHSYTKQMADEDKKEIRNSFLSDFEKNAPEKAILFYINENTHGMFVPNITVENIDRSIDGNNLEHRDKLDELKMVENLFTKSQKYFHTTNGEIAGVKIRAGISLYGLQDSSLQKLEESSLFSLNSFNSSSKNIISLFEPTKLKTVIIDSKKLKSLDSSLKLDNFENMFRGIYSLKAKKWIGVISNVVNNSEFNMSQTVRDHVKFNNWIEEFDRYFAVTSLQAFSDSNVRNIFFHYSPIYKNENLDVISIENKIRQFNTKPNEITFVIDLKLTENWQYENIKKLQNVGFNIAFYDIIDKKIINKVNPNHIIISKKNYAEKIEFPLEKIIFDEINSHEDFKLAANHKCLNYSGSIIQEENSLKSFEFFSNVRVK